MKTILTGFLSGSELLWREAVGAAHKPGVLEFEGANHDAVIYGGPGSVIGVENVVAAVRT